MIQEYQGSIIINLHLIKYLIAIITMAIKVPKDYPQQELIQDGALKLYY